MLSYQDGFLYAGRTINFGDEVVPVGFGHEIPVVIGTLIGRRERRRGYELTHITPQLVIEEDRYEEFNNPGTDERALVFDQVINFDFPAPRIVPHIDTAGVAIGVPIREAQIRVFQHVDEVPDDFTDASGSDAEESEDDDSDGQWV